MFQLKKKINNYKYYIKKQLFFTQGTSNHQIKHFDSYL